MYHFTNEQTEIFQSNKYIIIDNFLDNTDALNCQKEILECDKALWDRYNNCFEQKYTYRDKYNFPLNSKNLFTQFTSDLFLSELNRLTKLNLINDPTRMFWGIHLFENGDKLDIHVDAGRHLSTNFTKAVTFGLYLSYDWKEENKGYLEFWKGDNSYEENPKVYSCTDKILPLFNRCVIFENNDTSWHGAPDDCICNNEKRIFLTCSYLMKDSTDSFKNERKKALFVKRPQDPDDIEKDRLRILRANPATCKDVYKTNTI